MFANCFDISYPSLNPNWTTTRQNLLIEIWTHCSIQHVCICTFWVWRFAVQFRLCRKREIPLSSISRTSRTSQHRYRVVKIRERRSGPGSLKRATSANIAGTARARIGSRWRCRSANGWRGSRRSSAGTRRPTRKRDFIGLFNHGHWTQSSFWINTTRQV